MLPDSITNKYELNNVYKRNAVLNTAFFLFGKKYNCSGVLSIYKKVEKPELMCVVQDE